MTFSAWQYITAKRLRIDTQNRIAMARMFMANEQMFKNNPETQAANSAKIISVVAKNVFGKKEDAPSPIIKIPPISAQVSQKD